MKNLIKYFYIKIFANQYEYGICSNIFARRHKRKGNVQFIFSKVKGISGKKRLWADFDSSWWNNFKTTK